MKKLFLLLLLTYQSSYAAGSYGTSYSQLSGVEDETLRGAYTVYVGRGSEYVPGPSGGILTSGPVAAGDYDAALRQIVIRQATAHDVGTYADTQTQLYRLVEAGYDPARIYLADTLMQRARWAKEGKINEGCKGCSTAICGLCSPEKDLAARLSRTAIHYYTTAAERTLDAGEKITAQAGLQGAQALYDAAICSARCKGAAHVFGFSAIAAMPIMLFILLHNNPI